MSDGSESAVVGTVTRFIYDNFVLARQASITATEPLLATGIVDSLGLLSIVTFLESEFGIEINDRDVTVAHFMSIQATAAYVCRQLAASRHNASSSYPKNKSFIP